MTFRRSTLATAAVALLGLGLVADARAADQARVIPAIDTGPGIDAARGDNLVWLASDPDRRVGKLLVFLPFGGVLLGSIDFEEIGSEGGRLGYHTIVLPYKNDVPIAVASGCGNGELASSAPTNCAIDARTEILSGSVLGGASTVVNVDRANSIENRLTKVLQYLALTYPAEGWSKFLDGAQPKWSETVIAGGSLGAGQAALIGQLHQVHRVALFAGWTDARHGWVTLAATPEERYSALIHQREQFFGRTCYAYFALHLAPSCPLPPFTPVDDRPLPFGTSQLVFNLEPPVLNPPGTGDIFHNSTVRDARIATEADGTPSQKLLNAWRSTLGDSDADTYLDPAETLVHTDNCPDTANASQADADSDGTGDACDPTPRGIVKPTIIVTGLTADATGPGGALVGYTATATDDLDPDPTPICTPAAGSLFAIGDTSVTCTATDLGGNTATASFVVTVRGADHQLADLRTAVDGIGPGYSLINKISDVQAALANNDVPGGCAILSAFVNEVGAQSGKKIPVGTAASLIADASRIQAVLGC